MVLLAQRILRSWDLEESPGVTARFSRLWDMPISVAAQIITGMFNAANGQPPSFLKELI